MYTDIQYVYINIYTCMHTHIFISMGAGGHVTRCLPLKSATGQMET